MEVHSSLPARLFPMMYVGSHPGGSLHHLPGSNLTYSGENLLSALYCSGRLSGLPGATKQFPGNMELPVGKSRCILNAQSCPSLCDPVNSSPPGSCLWDFRQEHWSELPFAFPGDLPDPGIKLVTPVSPALAGRFFTTEPSGKP